MSKNSPAFRSIAADGPLEVPDEALKALGDVLGVPTMVKPEPAQIPKISASPEQLNTTTFSDIARTPPALERRTPSLGERPKLARLAPEPATEKVTVELPAYLTAALRREGAERRVTTRMLVMMGLQSLGFEVDERDLVPDGRRTRSRTRN